MNKFSPLSLSFHILILFFFSCTSEIEKSDTPPITGSYISTYLIKPEIIGYEQIFNNNSFHLQFYLDGDKTTFSDQSFLQIAENNKDIGYKDFALPANMVVLSDTIKSIHIYTIDDFNEIYKKGDRINNITTINYKSFYEFIESDYQDKTKIDNSVGLNEFNNRIVNLFLCGFDIKLDRIPKKSGTYLLKIEIETYSNTIEKEFTIYINS